MQKRDHKILSFLLFFILVTGVAASAMDEGDNPDEPDMESKARQAHKLAASDMMYQNEEWKALYYQNQTIIQILKQIRDSMEVIKSQGSKKNPDEKIQSL